LSKTLRTLTATDTQKDFIMTDKTTTTVSRSSRGQYQTTVPKALAEALDLDGKEISWSLDGDALRVEIEGEADDRRSPPK